MTHIVERQQMAIPKSDRTGHVVHKTLTFERQFSASKEVVFRAFADPIARAKWAAPSPSSIVIYESENFVIDGKDKFRCGSRKDPNIHGETRYLDILNDDRIVSSETLTMDGNRLCASLTTVELTTDGSTTLLEQTTHIASFVGDSMIEGFNQGNNVSLDNLVKFVGNPRAA